MRLEEVFIRLKSINQSEVKVTVLKVFFAQQELEDRSNRSCLGRCIATEGSAGLG